MGLCALAVLMILKRWRRLPASLLLIVLGIAAQTIWQVDRHGVGLVGEIDVQFRAVGVPELTRGNGCGWANWPSRWSSCSMPNPTAACAALR